jgi:hypothetical protein
MEEREGNHNKTTHLEFHAFCQQPQNTRHDERAAPTHQESPQRTATCARNRGRAALPDRRSAGAPDFRSVVPSPENSIVVVFGNFGPRTAGYQTGILCEERSELGGVCLNHTICCILKLIFERGKAKIVAIVDFLLPNFC